MYFFFFLKQLIFILFCFLISFTNIVRFLSTAYAQTNFVVLFVYVIILQIMKILIY